MAEQINFEEFKKDLKVQKAKNWVKEKVDSGKRKVKKTYEEWKPFLYENRGIITTAAVGAGIKLVRDGYRRNKQKREEFVRDTRFYDRRTDSYTYTRKPLSKKQALELDRRYREGENKREILFDMGLLKR